ncbi:hypothetical protein KC19_10G081100 [Ceratodon purpureus]|uniref:Bifunctional inhibitor/plant lipid transfer protein/seed storage helical domain-containing protein n=1 Tax=Ceratodon purpureus TaxID=3225 RepID=A0A8T0GI19_CERPU|nr:hypothetical protein KC19_10G081100 [Ceratodon purpureus]
MASMRVFSLLLVVLVSVEQLAAQAPVVAPSAAPPTSDSVIPGGTPGFYIVPVNCTLHNSSMISPTFCTYYDKQNMASLTGNCQPYLTNLDPMPTAGCCEGMNEVAYYRTACICDATFYPPVMVNLTRSLKLPSLCGITTDLCTQCPSFLVARTADYPVGGVEKRSTAAKVAAIVLGVILSVALVAAAIAITITELKKRKEEKNAEGVYEATPPGGAF